MEKELLKKLRRMKMFDITSRKKFVASFPDSFLIGAEVGVSSGDFSKNILSVGYVDGDQDGGSQSWYIIKR